MLKGTVSGKEEEAFIENRALGTTKKERQIEQKTFCLPIGQYGYQKIQNFKQIPDPKTNKIKNYFQKLAKYLWCTLSQILSSDLESA